MPNRDGGFFLDTSTQISKTWEDYRITDYLKKTLLEKNCYSSVYVKNEYKNRFLNDAILAYNVIDDSATISDVEPRLRKIGIRHDELPFKIIFRLLREYNNKKPLLRRLEKIIELTWEHLFYGNIKKPLFDLINCKDRISIDKKNGNYIINKDKCSLDCGIQNFLTCQKKALNALAEVDESKLDGTNDPKGTLKKTKSFSNDILNGIYTHGRTCKEISDAIIALEAKESNPEITIHSMDSDFKLLGEVLNIPTCICSKNKIIDSQQP